MPESLAVIRIDTRQNNRIIKEIGDNSKVARRAVKVTQEIVRMLTQTPGTDLSAPNQGSDLKGIIQRSVGGSINNTRLDIAGAILKTLEDVQENQRGHQLPADELLQNLEPTRIAFNRLENKWEVEARVTLESGVAFVVDFADLAQPSGDALLGN